MGIQTIVANISCASLENSLPWYEKLFGTSPTRRPRGGLAEWRFTDSAEVQLYENKANAGKLLGQFVELRSHLQFSFSQGT